jgi:hypothetical protein
MIGVLVFVFKTDIITTRKDKKMVDVKSKKNK